MSLLARSARLIRVTVDRLGLDLSGLTVLTEAATGPYAVTAAMAMIAGARDVIAVARNTQYGSADEAFAAVRQMGSVLGCTRDPQFHLAIGDAQVEQADLVTNLGMLRPIDRSFVDRLKPTATIALMCESWEWRPEDIDLRACRDAGTLVLGTNEHDVSWPVFRYCGPLAIRLILEAGFELLDTTVVVAGRDRFAPVVCRALSDAGARVRWVSDFSPNAIRRELPRADVLFLADYGADAVIVGDRGILTPGDVASIAPDITIIQLAGGVEEAALRRAGIATWPVPLAPPRRMSRTLAALGARPVIELHAAGLHVGALGARARLSGVNTDVALQVALAQSPLVQAPPHVDHDTC